MPDDRRVQPPRLYAPSLIVVLLVGFGGCHGHRVKPAPTAAPVTQPPKTPSEPAPTIHPAASYLGEGKVTCFREGTPRNDQPERAATCEISAVTIVNDKVLLASDKPFPGASGSSIFEVALSEGEPPTLGEQPVSFLTAAPVLSSRKYEDFTQSPTHDRLFVTTGFDRIKEDGSWDGYNALLTWKADHPEEVIVVTSLEAIGAPHSVSLRDALSRALRKDDANPAPEYFKIEGLADMGEGRLFFGIRERGSSYKDFEYAIDIIEAHYVVHETGAVTIDPKTVKLRFRAPPTLVLGHRVALSSLALDMEHDRLMLLASFEHEETDSHVGGFLFAVPLSAIESNDTTALAPSIVRAADGLPFIFGHKPEGITSMGDGRWLIFHDDDRVMSQTDIGLGVLTFQRGLHEAAYSMVRVH